MKTDDDLLRKKERKKEKRELSQHKLPTFYMIHYLFVLIFLDFFAFFLAFHVTHIDLKLEDSF